MRTGRAAGGGAGHRAGTGAAPPGAHDPRARSRPGGRCPRRCPRRTAAGACQRDDWTRRRARRGQRVVDAPRRPTGHAPRPGRCRQDPPGARGRTGGDGSLPGRRGTSQSRRRQGAGVLVPGAAAALGVVAATAAELGEQLGRATRRRPALLVLDGIEPFLEDARLVGELLTAAANLSVMATSRAALRLSAEHIYRVQPLTPPNAAALLVRACARARGLGSRRWPIVDAICARLDGLPLAIELAADRARMLPPRALLERLEHRLELLTGGPRDLPARQRSLRATLEWSWDALEPREQVLLGRLTAVRGRRLTGGDRGGLQRRVGRGVEPVVSSLVDKTSLLQTDSGKDAEPRFSMLDTVREFAAERAADHHGSPRSMAPARSLLPGILRARSRASGANGSAGVARTARAGASKHPPGVRAVAARRRRRRGAAGGDRVRARTALGRPRPRSPGLADAGARRRGAGRPRHAAPAPCYWDGQLALSQGRFDDARQQLEAAVAGRGTRGPRAGRRGGRALRSGAPCGRGRRPRRGRHL